MIYNMKKLLLFVVAATFFGCSEIAPVVPSLGDRKVLVEEFTGVRCVNCPAGASELANLQAIYGDRLVVVSIHAGDFSMPYSDSQFDFRTPQGSELEQFLGAPLGYPSAVVNRKMFSGQQSLQVGRSAWSGLIAAETKAASAANLGIQKTYNTATREFKLTIKVLLNDKTLANDVNLTAMLTEDNIMDTQETPSGKRSDYTHRHVLRSVVSGSAKGSKLDLSATTDVNLTGKLAPNWRAENCRLVIVLHRNTAATKEVLQVAEVKLVD